ncbi:hypothetical protein A167_02897 [Alcanivorax sp. S71-1-4]|uniref:retropepsin-like aspartic peptidase RloA3 n=1 Tax=Alcanivorax sp. S71-1-4 TaxID=1177159 RepID=UPI0013590D83|nr:ATP-dependent zinc protease [Alcanivorax sp. S71-1-4]KAF0807470.1 hypothetical protein A167_02897 [Alcanivorax sp. S71-1-4]
MRNRVCGITLAMLAIMATPALAAQKPLYGWIENASIEPWGVQVKAKLDTGALTSSMHAEDIERFDDDGEDWVRFTVEVENEATGDVVSREFSQPVFRDIRVRGAGGSERRPVVLMKICIGDTVYEEQFSLEDRSDMIYPLLIGRRTLQHLGPVDVTGTFMHRLRCDDDSAVMAHDDQPDDKDIDD